MTHSSLWVKNLPYVLNFEPEKWIFQPQVTHKFADGSKDGLGYAISHKDDDNKDRYLSFNGRASRSYERNLSASIL